jgi:hypothetical protein
LPLGGRGTGGGEVCKEGVSQVRKKFRRAQKSAIGGGEVEWKGALELSSAGMGARRAWGCLGREVRLGLVGAAELGIN